MKTLTQELKIKLLPIIVAVAFFMQMLDGSILNTALPEMARSMGENPLQMQAAVVSYMLSVAVFLPISGWLADRFGLKKMFLLAILIFMLGSLFCALSNSLVTLTIARVIQGMGGALLVPIGRLAVLKIYPRDRYVNVMSLIVLPALIGPLIGPFVGGILVEYLSWHWIFLINIPIGILCFVATMFIMPFFKTGIKIKPDWIGFILFDCSILLFFFMSSSKNFLPQIPKVYFLISAVMFLVIYWVYAKKAKEPLFKTKVFKTRSFTVGLIGNLFTRLSAGALPFVGPLFLQTALNYTPSKAGAALIPLGIAAMFAKAFAAFVIKNLGYKRFLLINTSILGALIACMSLVGESTPYYAILIIFAFIGMANSLQFTALNSLTLIDVPEESISEANSLLSVAMQISLALGVSLAAILIEKILSSNAQQNIIFTFQLTYIIIGSLTLVSALVFAFVPKNAGNTTR